MKMRSPFALAVLSVASAALAGGQQLTLEVSRDAKSMLVRTFRCGTPSKISVSVTAEGLVNGERRSLPLEVQATSEPGVFQVARQWPAEGTWVLTATARGEGSVSTLVRLAPGARIEIVSQRMTHAAIDETLLAAALRPSGS
jgi:hypothetical protein